MKKLLFFLTVLHAVHADCPDSMDLIAGGQCRRFYKEISAPRDETAEMAVKMCAEIQALPVIIHNNEQNQYWAAQIDPPGPNGTSINIALGLLCNTNTSKFEWSDGSATDFHAENFYFDHGNCNPACSMHIDENAYWFSSCGTDIAEADIYCTYQLPEPAPPPSGCANFDDDTDDGTCYEVINAVEDWQDAQLTCRNIGADLASIHNERENSFIRRLAVSQGAINGLFIGATVAGKGKQFGWIDGSEWDYENFYPGFPVDGIGECLAMDTLSKSGEWMNMDCSTNLAVVCARKEDPKPVCPPGPWTEGQVIASPGYPYDASVPCDYFLSVDAGKQVQVEIQILEANSCCDYLLLTDNLLGGNIVANLTGALSNQTYTTHSSNFMRVSWQPDGGLNVRGMMITFKGV